MIWIRFGRNEPQAPGGPLLDRAGHSFDLRAYAGGCALLIVFAPPPGLAGCDALLAEAGAAAQAESDAQALVVTPVRADLAAARGGLPVLYDEAGQLSARFRGLMEVDSRDQTVLYVLDRDAAPVYAWIGDCQDAAGLAVELTRRLQSAAFLCPECSVPDPAATAGWEVTY